MKFIGRSTLAFAFLAATLAVVGCTDKDKDTPPKTPAADKGGHPTEGPHGGALVEWGEEEYHLEFKVDHGKKQATVYILDESAKKATPIKAETLTLVIKNVQPPATVTLKAEPQQGDGPGTSSRFVGQHDALGKEMEFEGEVSGKIGDKAYAGDFKEKPHKHPKK